MKKGKRKISSGGDFFEENKKQRIDSIAGFCVVSVELQNSKWQKYIYYKEHKEKNDQHLPAGKTLFVTNLAPDTKEKDLENIFSVYGKVSSVHLESFRDKSVTQPIQKSVSSVNQPSTSQKLILEEKKKRLEESILEEEIKLPFSSAGYAHVVFEDAASLTKAIRSPVTGIDQKESGHDLKGLSKWLKQQKDERETDIAALEKEVNEYMIGYDNRKAEFQKRLERISSLPDEDGWVTVTKGKKKSKADLGPIGVAKIDQQTLKKLVEKEKKKHKTDFYRFQRTEQTNTHIQDLRKRFEQDKKRIEKLRQGRKFKPF